MFPIQNYFPTHLSISHKQHMNKVIKTLPFKTFVYILINLRPFHSTQMVCNCVMMMRLKYNQNCKGLKCKELNNWLKELTCKIS